MSKISELEDKNYLQFKEIKSLVAEVERLREVRETLSKQADGMIIVDDSKKIESLTKERDEFKNRYWDRGKQIGEFKAENSELKKDNKALAQKIFENEKAQLDAEEKDRKYIHDLETRCDPAGDVQRIASLTEQVSGLEVENGKLKAWNIIHETGKNEAYNEISRQREEIASLKMNGQITCTSCGAVFPDPHTQFCTL